MRESLILHPQSQCDAISRIEVEVTRSHPAKLALTYVVTGDIAALQLPPPDVTERTDGLWAHTCFEAFIRRPGEAYLEFNLSPSSHWATYHFTSYRTEMSAPPEARPLWILVRYSRDRLELDVNLSLAPLLGADSDTAWRVGLSAVIEETNGRKSYWALTHPPGKADFHHADGFALDLPPPERP